MGQDPNDDGGSTSSRAGLVIGLVAALISAGAIVYVAHSGQDAQRNALLRADRLDAYTTYVENLERHRLLLSNHLYLAEEGKPENAEFFRKADELIATLAADEKRVKILVGDDASALVDEVRKARLKMYNEFTCNIGLQGGCEEFPRVEAEAAITSFRANRENVDALLQELIDQARADVNG
jgi:hypothetical protein